MVQIKKWKKDFSTRSRKNRFQKKMSDWRKPKATWKKQRTFGKKTYRKMPFKSRITFPAQEKFLRSRIVSRKFKAIGTCEIGNDTRRWNEDNLKSIVDSAKFVGHIAEYEDMAVSYVKVKAKCINAKVQSYIADMSILSYDKKDNAGKVLQEAQLPKMYNENDLNHPQQLSTGLYPKNEIGDVTVVRKQNLLAAHKKARTTPWINCKEYISSPSSFTNTLFPTSPCVIVGNLDVNRTTIVAFEVTLYCVTKNRLVETTNLRTELVEMQMMDLVQKHAQNYQANPSMLIERTYDPRDPERVETTN